MDFLGQALARWHLSEQGYFVAFDVAGQSAETGQASFRFDLAGVRFSGGKASSAIVGDLRSWWHPSAYLTPSIVRAHLLPSLTETLSEEAVLAFRNFYGLGLVRVDRVLFFSHASPEKSGEAEEILRGHGIEVVYLERVAAQLLQLPANRVHTDPLVMQTIGLMRGAFREAGEKAFSPEPEKAPEPEKPENPQLNFDLFAGGAPVRGR